MKLAELIFESRKKNIQIMINGKEVPFGHPDHIADLSATLGGLERIRDCFQKGSGHRLIYAQTVGRLRKLIKELDSKLNREPVEDSATSL